VTRQSSEHKYTIVLAISAGFTQFSSIVDYLKFALAKSQLTSFQYASTYLGRALR
jgi:hypothetical protein